MGQRNNNQWILVLVIIAIGAAIFTVISRSNAKTLGSYTVSDKVENKEITQEESELDIPTEIITNDELGFSIEIPTDWEEVTQDGFQTFIHAPSASSIQIQVEEYDPSVNNMDAESASTEVAEDGKTFTGFTRVDNSHYELLYQDFENSTYDYMEQVYWDRGNIVRLLCTFKDENYERITPYYEKILNSFAWDRNDPIPSGYALYYNEPGGFEVGFPDTWTFANTDTTIAATDPDSGANMTVSFTENSAYLDTLTATDMANMLKPGRNNFMMKDYQNSKEAAVATSTYVVDDVQLMNKQYIFANGTYLVFVSFDYETGCIDDTIPDACASLFRFLSTNEKTAQNASEGADGTVQGESQENGKQAKESPSNSGKVPVQEGQAQEDTAVEGQVQGTQDPEAQPQD